MSKCYLCPRLCGVDRAAGVVGFCGEKNEIRIARYSLHKWEEPPLVGENGSGTIFFSGCSMRCEFCQNRAISHTGSKGYTVSIDELADIMLKLQDMGAENINLVTPTHFADKIALALERTKNKLSIPVVYNSSGYERTETLHIFDGLVDIYLPDYKYFSDELAKKYSHAKNYSEYTEEALCEMFRQVGSMQFDERGIMKRGLIVRHLVLPSHRHDSIKVLCRIAEILPKEDILLSLMNQYTPDFAIEAKSPHTELHRRVTTFEYNSVLEYAAELGFCGFSQERSSSSTAFTPDF